MITRELLYELTTVQHPKHPDKLAAGVLFDVQPDPVDRPPTTREKFDAWIALNPEVLGLFIRFALEVKNAGQTKYGARSIFERIRWEKATTLPGDGEFLINNNYAPYLARLAMARTPALAGFFVTRKLQNERVER